MTIYTRVLSQPICTVSEAWWHLGRNGCLKAWHAGGRDCPPPFKVKRSLLLDVPGAADPNRIRSDLAHIWPIGVGKEFVGSGILLLAHMQVFPGRSIGVKLTYAYGLFREWCTANRETCKITEFALRTFKVQTLPWFNWAYLLFGPL